MTEDTEEELRVTPFKQEKLPKELGKQGGSAVKKLSIDEEDEESQLCLKNPHIPTL
jgi:hypothetical protein